MIDERKTKMKKIKRYLSILLVLSIMLCSTSMFTVNAAQVTETDDVVIDTEANLGGEDELQPMVANGCGYTSVNQMQHLITSGQAPSSITFVHNGFQGQQPHVHFSDGTAMNLDGSPHHGNPQPTVKTMEWLNNHGWCIL